MSDSQDHNALADAICQRRAELAISQSKAVERTREYDVQVYNSGGKGRRSPGLSSTKWRQLEHGKPAKLRDTTLELVDAALRWPEGTSRAILMHRERPEGAPVMLPGNEEHPHGDAAVVELAQAVSKLADVVRASTQQHEMLEWLRHEVDHVRDRVTLLHMRMDGTA